jgi:16S rRNA (uracil1498-N3)-methyltransferase
MTGRPPVTAAVFIADSSAFDGQPTQVTVAGAEGKHAVTVRRINVGEVVVVTDGRGQWASGPVANVHGRDAFTMLVEVQGFAPLLEPQVVVVQAIPKGDRGEVAVETMTEVGVDVIVPWVSERTQVRLDADREAKLVGKWRATAREAAKQARRTYVPVVADAVRELAAIGLQGSCVIVLDAEGATSLGDIELPTSGTVTLVVGPEGGVSPAELVSLQQAGATVAKLGPSVLRASTAGTVAAGIVLSRTARWSATAGL